MTPQLLPVLHESDSPFSYDCRACNRCCRNRGIQVNPFELIHLAAHLGLSTTEVRQRWIDATGVFLRRRPDGTCPFLADSGCTIHPARPLVCRLYPLGRIELPDGEERYVQLEPAPGSEGVYGEAGQVRDYLASQDVPRYAEGERRYRRLLEVLTAHDGNSPARPGEPGRGPVADPEGQWILDPDPVIQAWTQEHGVAEPADPDARVDLHLEALLAWALGSWEPPPLRHP